MDGLYQDRPNTRCRVKDPRTAESVHSLAPSEISRKGIQGPVDGRIGPNF